MVSVIIQWLTAFGAVLGGFDLLTGCRLHIGEKFREGLMLLGPTALSMAGIICLCPLIGNLLKIVLVPVCGVLGLDAGLLGGIIAIDMGGYPLAMQLAGDAVIGRFSGILAGSTLGCTLCFTIPMALSLVKKENLDDFISGLVSGLIACPIGLLAGGLVMQIPLLTLLRQCAPFLLMALLIPLGLRLAGEKTFSFFRGLSRGIQVLAIAGLMLGIVKKMTGLAVLNCIGSVDEAMAVVSSIGLSLVGMLPLLELLLPLAKKAAGSREIAGLDSAGLTGLVVSIFTVTPAIPMLNLMNRRSRILVTAFMVSSASLFSAHLAFTIAVDASMAAPLLVCKIAGAFAGLLPAFVMTRNLSGKKAGSS